MQLINYNLIIQKEENEANSVPKTENNQVFFALFVQHRREECCEVLHIAKFVHWLWLDTMWAA
jgi:hypothetical protein